MNILRLILPTILACGSVVRADQFATGQSASSVLGQTNFNSKDSFVAPNRFLNPEAVAVDPTTGKVFVADSAHFRILRFSDTAALADGSFPEAVIGQPNFSSVLQNQGGSAGQNTLNFCYQITVDTVGRLWVCDSGNNRVLCFVAASFLSNNPPADYVFGQPDFVTSTAGLSISKTDYPAGIAVGPDDSLWVADADNNRVLRFANISSKASGANADGVLGQSNFFTKASAASQTRMNSPFSLSVDTAGRLWVADTDNHRVLRFDNAASLGIGAPASGVLGQSAFTGGLPGISATALDSPYGVLAGPDGTVYVGDWNNRRVMGFRNAAAKANGAAADFVLGKPNFTLNTAGPSQTLLSGPVNLCLSGVGDLFVADFEDNRVVRFSPVKSPTLVIRTRKKMTNAALFAVAGTAAGQVTTVKWKVGAGGSFKKKATGTASWSFKVRLKPGKNLITVIAEGPGGTSLPRTLSVIRK